MRVGIGCDHGGFLLKEACMEVLKSLGHSYLDYGTFDTQSVDYPDYGVKVARAVMAGEVECGIVLCGTGIGISIAANKVRGIRCAHVTDAASARLAREHNDANMIALGARITAPDLAKEIVRAFFTATFQGGRHLDRIKKIAEVENQNDE